ncbi:polyphosphate kinase 1 [Sphingobacteriaceae bacterium WQ 2009]|uniref:Polyphosphate kinase n=1 Tax=Rhinopithecimicrobium faecis TaxID=2820698 RepID=A0A8T4HCU5_9SPHI|nr:polyphosphate kinase 1 [Sphingobacteriaceae bacterium WQ 2009]
MLEKYPIYNRELSWLSFNDRVLQEAADEQVPLLERLRFLAIYSSNLEEFYRVRVAILHRIAANKKKYKRKLDFKPKQVLAEIQQVVIRQEQKFDFLLEKVIFPGLEAEGVRLVEVAELKQAPFEQLQGYFHEKVLKHLIPVWINSEKPPTLQGNRVYFIVKLLRDGKPKFAYIELPPNTILPRFYRVNQEEDTAVILLDRMIIAFMADVFAAVKFEQVEAYEFKLSRDAELDFDEESSETFVEILKKSLKNREQGSIMRLEYNAHMPTDILDFLKIICAVDDEGLIAIRRYFNFKDFIDFPKFIPQKLVFPSFSPCAIPLLDLKSSFLAQIKNRDFLVSFPYQRYDFVLHFLREAAMDTQVEQIDISLYRVAQTSNVVSALIIAARNGIRVQVFLEIKARFDEQANLYWHEIMKNEGITVFLGNVDHKLHAKSCLIYRKEGAKQTLYSFLSTGNFNEKTAKIYCDHGLFTAHKGITKDLKRMFEGLKDDHYLADYQTIICAPRSMRTYFTSKIAFLIKEVKKGEPVRIILKMNSLTDEGIIQSLYEANNAGIKIQLIVRGMCCLIPGIYGFSENITIISIIDRFLEHARVLIFEYGTMKDVYLSSADLMTRNLDRRVEVAFPLYDPLVKEEICAIIALQLQDNVKARVIDPLQKNNYKRDSDVLSHQSQLEIYNYLKLKNS